MFAREYYYLIAGLPDLDLDDRSKSFDLKAYIQEVCELIHPSDKEFVEEIFLRYDHQNILNMLRGRDELLVDKGNYSIERLRELLINPEGIPQYLIDIINKYQHGIELGDIDEHEFSMGHYVWSRFYKEIERRSKNPFSRAWYRFDQMLRNIQSAWMCRQLNIPLNGQLVGYGDVLDIFLKSHAPDFGLKREMPLGDEIFSLLEADIDILEREYRFDKIRFAMADELTIFNDFDINKILAFLAKADIIDRWVNLDKEKGRVIFQGMIGSLTAYKEKV